MTFNIIKYIITIHDGSTMDGLLQLGVWLIPRQKGGLTRDFLDTRVQHHLFMIYDKTLP
jgi:hypothetical protein